MGYLVSISAIYSDSFGIVFSYDEIIDLPNLLNYSQPLLIGTFVFFISYNVLFRKREFESVSKTQNTIIIKRKSGIIDFFCIYIQIAIVMFVLAKLAANSTMEVSHTGIIRYLSGKENYLLMIIQSALIFLSSRNIRIVVIFSSFFISIIFAWFSGTREAIIPIASLVLDSVLKNKKTNALIYISMLLFLYSFVHVSRSTYVKFDFLVFFDSLSYALTILGDSVLSFLSYTFGYSVLHFTYVNMSETGLFTLSDLIYSLTPLPSYFLPPVDTSLWRVDVYRPMGAYSELYRVSPFAFFLFLFFLGGLAKSINNVRQRFVKIVLLVIFSLLTIMLFQYGLRTNLWFIVFIISILISNGVYTRFSSRR